jgi:hypothetical protein
MTAFEIYHTVERSKSGPPGGPLKTVVDATVESTTGQGALAQWAHANGLEGHPIGRTQLAVLGEGLWHSRRVGTKPTMHQRGEG